MLILYKNWRLKFRGSERMANVVLERVSKVYPNGSEAVRDLSLDIADGDLMVLVGPSGCGKTTTLRLIAGLEEATAGRIHIGSRLVNTLPPHQRNVAMVFQRSTLYPHLDVERNLSIALKLRRPFRLLDPLIRRLFRQAHYAELQREQRVTSEMTRNAVQWLGLEPLLDRLPGQLSGGQQQRVALGRAIVRRPDVFLLDEPLSHLDNRLRGELRHQLHLLQRQLRATMIYVTHDQAEAMTLADRVAVMERGVVQQVDRPSVIYERPANRFVASFVGWPPMNFADGRLVPKDGQLCFVCEDWCQPLPPRMMARWQGHAGRAVTLGIRPEDICLSESRQSDWTLSMEPVLVEPLGHSCVVTLRHRAWQALALGSNSFDRRWENVRREREMIEASFNIERAHLFDRSTGVALSNGSPAG
jgi:multiple sugar transport system ATP-binding protein